MAPLKTIVVPTDCSELSHRALRYADAIARRTGASVVAVYAEHISGQIEGEGIAGSLSGSDDLEWMLMPLRQRVCDSVASALSAETARRIVVADERPADAIIEVANRRNADLIVMGTHDRNRLMRAVLGSVTDIVLRESSRPVLILREHTDPADHDPIRRVLCPFRDSPASRKAVERAVELANVYSADLVLLHMAPSGEPLPGWLPSVASEGAIRSGRRLDITSDAGARIVALADDLAADLVVIGTSHRHFSDPATAGAPASQIVHTANCPVLAVTGD